MTKPDAVPADFRGIAAAPAEVDLAPRFPDLAGKLILVTGATTGIGAEIARQAARNEAVPLLIGRRKAELERVAVQIAEETGVRAPVVTADIGDDDAIQRIVAAAREVAAQIDVLVHCAGVFHYLPFADTDTALLDEMHRANVRGPFALTKAVLPHLSKNASIVFIGSNVSTMGYAYTSAYTATKGGVEALARCLAVELAPQGIRVNTVSPGLTKTDMTIRMREEPELERAARAVIPADRIGETREIAAATLFLCSASSSYVVGATLTVDGGHSAP
ncbi:SDR family NAD(P)-dependent oxidoreductase [Kutzneria chonburiensis]|uniref:SDR family NAD(P)-dependent oxidoreductase n=1 Tax=Kutzneria chonburiensis TaxID=1483604 RepID=A0ABV6MQX9_9PSEU|nr:SDR family oxidoreductase [Kutzneria chonburiensis]